MHLDFCLYFLVYRSLHPRYREIKMVISSRHFKNQSFIYVVASNGKESSFDSLNDCFQMVRKGSLFCIFLWSTENPLNTGCVKLPDAYLRLFPYVQHPRVLMMLTIHSSRDKCLLSRQAGQCPLAGHPIALDVK